MKKILFIFIAGFTMIACKQTDKNATPGNPGAMPSDSAVKIGQNQGGETQAQNTSVDASNLTTVQWLDTQDIDFGKINEGQNLEVSFHFKNTGKKQLVVSRVWAQCGCTVPETPQKPYAPGEEGVIKASFNSSGKLGSNTKEVYMNANTNPETSILVFHVEVLKSGK